MLFTSWWQKISWHFYTAIQSPSFFFRKKRVPFSCPSCTPNVMKNLYSQLFHCLDEIWSIQKKKGQRYAHNCKEIIGKHIKEKKEKTEGKLYPARLVGLLSSESWVTDFGLWWIGWQSFGVPKRLESWFYLIHDAPSAQPVMNFGAHRRTATLGVRLIWSWPLGSWAGWGW